MDFRTKCAAPGDGPEPVGAGADAPPVEAPGDLFVDAVIYYQRDGSAVAEAAVPVSGHISKIDETEDAVTVDEDGVMTVNKNALKNLGVSEETMTIEMKLEYEGKTFTDELIIYLTELEVETNV